MCRRRFRVGRTNVLFSCPSAETLKFSYSVRNRDPGRAHGMICGAFRRRMPFNSKCWLDRWVVPLPMVSWRAQKNARAELRQCAMGDPFFRVQSHRWCRGTVRLLFVPARWSLASLSCPRGTHPSDPAPISSCSPGSVDRVRYFPPRDERGAPRSRHASPLPRVCPAHLRGSFPFREAGSRLEAGSGPLGCARVTRGAFVLIRALFVHVARVWGVLIHVRGQ